MCKNGWTDGLSKCTLLELVWTEKKKRCFLKPTLPPRISDSLVFIRLNKTAVTWLLALDAKSRRWICGVSARRTHVLVVSHYSQSWLIILPTHLSERSCIYCPLTPPLITSQVSLMWPTWSCQERVCEFTRGSDSCIKCASTPAFFYHLV